MDILIGIAIDVILDVILDSGGCGRPSPAPEQPTPEPAIALAAEAGRRGDRDASGNQHRQWREFDHGQECPAARHRRGRPRTGADAMSLLNRIAGLCEFARDLYHALPELVEELANVRRRRLAA